MGWAQLLCMGWGQGDGGGEAPPHPRLCLHGHHSRTPVRPGQRRGLTPTASKAIEGVLLLQFVPGLNRLLLKEMFSHPPTPPSLTAAERVQKGV